MAARNAIAAVMVTQRQSPTTSAAEKLEASARASIERLQSDYIDLYYLHFPSRSASTCLGGARSSRPRRPDGSSRRRTSDGSMADFERQVKNVKRFAGSRLA